MKPLRWGVLGAASIARRRLIPALQGSGLHQVVAIGARDQERADALAAEAGLPRAYLGYQAVLDDPEVEAVYLPLPNHLHLPWALKALEAGKHLLVEKPLTLDAAEAETLVEASSRRPELVVMEAFMYRFHPRWRQVKSLVEGGAIGQVRSVDLVFCAVPRPAGDYRYDPAMGGGALLDLGCYGLSAARWMFGREPQRVVAAAVLQDEHGVDLQLQALLDFGDGHASFGCSMRSFPHQHARIVGDRGLIEVPRPFNPDEDAGQDIHIEDAEGRRTIHVPPAKAYQAQVDAFAAAVRGDPTAVTPLSDALHNMRALTAIAASLRESGWQTP